MKKQFEEVTVWVRRLDINLDVQLTLPCSDPYAELDKCFGGELWRDFDYEIVDVDDEYNIFNSFQLYGYENIDKLNSIAEQLTEIDNLDLFLAVNEAHGADLKELLEDDINDKYYLYEDTSAEDYIYTQVEEGYHGDIPDTAKNYLDYKKWGRDLILSGEVHETSYGLLT